MCRESSIDGRRLDLVEMVEDAGLMPAEQALALRIADVAGVAGEVDARIERHDRRVMASPTGSRV